MWPNIRITLQSFEPAILIVLAITVLLVGAVLIMLVPWKRLSEALNHNGWYAWGTALLVLDGLLYGAIQLASLKEATHLFFWVTHGDTTRAVLIMLFLGGLACLNKGLPSRRQSSGERFI